MWPFILTFARALFGARKVARGLGRTEESSHGLYIFLVAGWLKHQA